MAETGAIVPRTRCRQGRKCTGRCPSSLPAVVPLMAAPDDRGGETTGGDRAALAGRRGKHVRFAGIFPPGKSPPSSQERAPRSFDPGPPARSPVLPKLRSALPACARFHAGRFHDARAATDGRRFRENCTSRARPSADAAASIAYYARSQAGRHSPIGRACTINGSARSHALARPDLPRIPAAS